MLDLDEHDAVYRQLQNTLQIQVAALARCQSDNGLWPTLLNDPDSYLEASATAGFAAGIFKAIRLGYLEADYLPVAERACEELSTIFHHRVNCCRCRSAPRWATTLITIVTSRSPPCPMARRWRCCAWWKPCIARCKSVT